MYNKILITEIEDLEELYELARERLYDTYESFEETGFDDEDEAIWSFVDEIYLEEVDEIYDADDLSNWWWNNGWTLDRGYGGPDYKRRVADNTNWEGLFDLLQEYPENGSLGEIAFRPVQINDLVIFSEDWDYSEEEEANTILSWNTGFIVGISASRGLDNDSERNEDLRGYLEEHNFKYVGPNKSVWEGGSEEGFLVHANSKEEVEELYALGNQYEQDHVAVWEAPLNVDEFQLVSRDADFYTEIDGQPYSIKKKDISEYIKTVKENTIKEATEEEIDYYGVEAGATLFVNGKQYISPEGFNGPYSNNGYIYKSFDDFEDGGIGYVPEHGFDNAKDITKDIEEYLLYFIDKNDIKYQEWFAVEDLGRNAFTKADFIKEITEDYPDLFDKYELENTPQNAALIADDLFDILDWQYPSTLMLDLLD